MCWTTVGGGCKFLFVNYRSFPLSIDIIYYRYAGVHPESEEAYQMACRGLVRPDTRETPPMIYGVKCIHFDLPDITLGQLAEFHGK